jgi:hypothetical protein
MHAQRYYRHSGRFSPAGLAAAGSVGLVAGVVLGVVYAYAILYIPLAGTVTFILTGGFAFVLGLVVGMVLHATKVRSTTVAALTALPVALVALLASWIAWLYALLQRADAVDVSLLDFVTNPAALWQVLLEVNRVGAWSLKGATPTGGLLWALWACEALIIVVGTVVVARGHVDEPFCEDCERWCEEEKGIAVTGPAEAGMLRERLEASDFAALKALPPATQTATTRFDLHQCPQCHATSTLTAKAITVTEKNGKSSTSEHDVVRFLNLSRSELEAFRAALPRSSPTEAPVAVAT